MHELALCRALVSQVNEIAHMPNRLVCGACGDWRTDLLEMLHSSVELDVPEPTEATRNV
jgi:hypothetical protein